MGELQDIKDSLSYKLSKDRNLGIEIFTNSQATLEALKNLNGCSTL